MTDGLTIVRLNPGRLTEFGRRHPFGRAMQDFLDYEARMAEARQRAIERGDPLPIAGGASFFNYAEAKILGHAVGKSAWAKPTVWLALCTVVPEDAKTGITITEATYTGYARKEVPEGSWGAASEGAPSSIKNSAELVFAECTSGESTIIGWALCDNATKSEGNGIVWGTCSSTTISTTQTPAKVAANGLEVTQD